MVNVKNTPKYQFQAVMANRHNDSGSVMVQRKLKSGKWGKPSATKKLRKSETAQDVVDRLNRYNPSDEYRIAE